MPKVLNPKAPGWSIKDAIIIEALTVDDGITEEYKYLEKRFGKRGKDWQVVSVAVDVKNNRVYDVLYLWLKENPKEWKKDPKDWLSEFLYPIYNIVARILHALA